MGTFRTQCFKLADATLGAVCCELLGRWHFRFRALPVPDTLPPGENVRRILVIRPGGMGDMIVLLPVLRRLAARFPAARLDLVCERRNVEVLRLAGLGDSAMVYNVRPWSFLRALRRRTYDLAIDTEQFHHFSAVFGLLSGARARIGFKINPRRNPLYTHLVNYAMDASEGEQFMRLLRPLGIAEEPYRLDGALSDVELPLGAGLESTLAAACGAAPLVAVHPGASTRYKRWDAQRFCETLRQLAAAHGLGAVLVGGPEDRPLAERVAAEVRAAGGVALSLAGQLDLPRAAGVIRRARLFLGADSGLAHLAVALGTPSIVLFGPSDHCKWGHADAAHAVVRRDLACAPCFVFGYHKPCRHIACMAQLTVPDVMAAAQRVLAPPAELPAGAATPH